VGGAAAGAEAGDLEAWLANPGGRHLFLAGPAGTGKTHAATAVAFRYLAERGGQVAWWSVPSLLDALRPGQAGDVETTWQRVRAADLLVLDDLAHTRPTEWAVERMWMLADARVGAELRTVITTNATWDDLTGDVGCGDDGPVPGRDDGREARGESMRRPLW
jgi:DNA replication protein DnaC